MNPKDNMHNVEYVTTDNKLTVKNDEAMFFFEPRPVNLVFMGDDGEEIGKFEYDKEKQQWTFEGDADESAKMFTKFMFAHFQSILEGDRDGLLKS